MGKGRVRPPTERDGQSIGRGLPQVLNRLGAATALVVTSPLLGVAAIAVRATMGRPVLFRQERAGRHSQPFELVKFRTMRSPRPGEDGPEFDRVRLTRVGRFLRATSIDELPSFWNVLTGDLALVGPRPLPVRYLARYSPEHARRHDVRPGVTGLAQVIGRNQLSWEQKFDLDVWYVQHRTVRLDIKILLQTAVKVLGRDGIDAAGDSPMPEFLRPATQDDG